MKINQPELKRAQLETIYWWVDCEHRYHDLFKQDKEIDIKYQNTFYEFTNKYSVRRTLSGKGQGVTDELLSSLNVFKTACLKGNHDIIDETDTTLAKAGFNSLRSLLSKYATLINPLVYTMYDTMAVANLKQLDGKGVHSKFRSYTDFYTEFTKYEKSLYEQIEDADIAYYIGLCRRQGKPIDIHIFKRRLADKYLWIANTSRNE